MAERHRFCLSPFLLLIFQRETPQDWYSASFRYSMKPVQLDAFTFLQLFVLLGDYLMDMPVIDDHEKSLSSLGVKYLYILKQDIKDK